MISRKCMRIRASMYNLQDMMHSELLFLKHYEGIPPIITETTGAKSEVQDICEELIVPADSEHLAGKIKWFFF